MPGAMIGHVPPGQLFVFCLLSALRRQCSMCFGFLGCKHVTACAAGLTTAFKPIATLFACLYLFA